MSPLAISSTQLCPRRQCEGRGPSSTSTGSNGHSQGAAHSLVQSGPFPSWQPRGCVWGQRGGGKGLGPVGIMGPLCFLTNSDCSLRHT